MRERKWGRIITSTSSVGRDGITADIVRPGRIATQRILFLDQAKGRAKKAVGDLNSDERLHDEGEVDEAAGRVQESFGKGRRKVGEAIQNIGKNVKK